MMIISSYKNPFPPKSIHTGRTSLEISSFLASFSSVNLWSVWLNHANFAYRFDAVSRTKTCLGINHRATMFWYFGELMNSIVPARASASNSLMTICSSILVLTFLLDCSIAIFSSLQKLLRRASCNTSLCLWTFYAGKLYLKFGDKRGMSSSLCGSKNFKVCSSNFLSDSGHVLCKMRRLYRVLETRYQELGCRGKANEM